MTSRSKKILNLAIAGKRASYFGGESAARKPRIEEQEQANNELEPQPPRDPIQPFNLTEREEEELTGSVRSIDLERFVLVLKIDVLLRVIYVQHARV